MNIAGSGSTAAADRLRADRFVLPRRGFFEVFAPQHLVFGPFAVSEVGDPLNAPVGVVLDLGYGGAFPRVQAEAMRAALLIEHCGLQPGDAREGWWFVDDLQELAGEVRVEAQRGPGRDPPPLLAARVVRALGALGVVA